MEYEFLTDGEMIHCLRGFDSFSGSLFYTEFSLVLIANRQSSGFQFYHPNILWWYLPRGALKSPGLSFPEQVEKCFADDGCKKELFLQEEEGVLKLGVIDFFGASVADGVESVRFSIVPRVSREVWRQVGSYTEWCLYSDGVRTSIESVEEFVDFVRRQESKHDLDYSLTRYDGDRMELVANGQLAFVRYSNAANRCCFYERSHRAEDLDDVLFSRFHDECTVPRRGVVERSIAILLMVEFIRSGVVSWNQ